MLKTPKEKVGVILLGNGELFNKLKEHEGGNIMLPGFKANVYEYLIASDYYISASDTEGLANTLLESMTVGLPCVLSDIPSHREVMNRATKPIGFLFDNHDVNAMTHAIQQVLKLDTYTTSAYIRQLFEKHYTAKQMSEEYQKTYINLLDKKQ